MLLTYLALAAIALAAIIAGVVIPRVPYKRILPPEPRVKVEALPKYVDMNGHTVRHKDDVRLR